MKNSHMIDIIAEASRRHTQIFNNGPITALYIHVPELVSDLGRFQGRFECQGRSSTSLH